MNFWKIIIQKHMLIKKESTVKVCYYLKAVNKERCQTQNF